MITWSTFCLYLIMREIEHLFMYLRDICIFPSISSLFTSFPILSIGCWSCITNRNQFGGLKTMELKLV